MVHMAALADGQPITRARGHTRVVAPSMDHTKTRALYSDLELKQHLGDCIGALAGWLRVLEDLNQFAVRKVDPVPASSFRAIQGSAWEIEGWAVSRPLGR
jgi:hypothetical protein